VLVETFKEAMPIVTALRNDKLLEIHWAQIKNLIKKDFDVTEDDFTLKSLIDLDIIQFQEDITSISTKATQEANLREQIQNIKDTWQKINFTVNYDEKCESYVLSELDDIYTALDESLANLNMILGSRFVAPLRADAE
jgi:dynein heavy chain